ncbi:MAG: peptidase S10 [Alphaproteobacteria bacterium]|nr:peptidase S10 [Alphaproteobacteria bacterium]
MMGAALALLAGAASAQESPRASSRLETKKPSAASTAEPNRGLIFSPQAVTTQGSVTVEGQKIDYHAVAGTIIVHPKGWDDVASLEETANTADLGDKKNPKAEASMFYVAYFKNGAPSADRPITFIYNGGPGSSSMWLHMGAWGPRRIVTSENAHTPPAPYQLVNNAYSLLDVSDLVFIDAPGTGFSRIAGKDKEKAFYGIDADGYAFSQFVTSFLSQYGRWNSPKYLFGESYGTPRSAVLVNDLETGDNVDFNGVILLSQILNFSLSVDGPEYNPGSDQAYIVGLPTYAATAWYHNRLGPNRPADLQAYLKEVEQFATTDYAEALQQGALLSPERKQQIAERMSHYIGLPVSYILKADLRVTGGEFEKNLLDADGESTGRLDTRFAGPQLDPLSKGSEYDPQAAALSSAYTAALNDYVRNTLHFGRDMVYKPEINVFRYWDFRHKPPGIPFAPRGTANVMPDLAMAMKYNPTLKVMLLGGYFDLATPFYEGWYEMHHLPIPDDLQANITYHYYQSGHMVYARPEDLHKMHDDVATFIRSTENTGRAGATR